ncbi:MAG: apolipoprotein N-acyltransferase [Kaiparowitsia implicata GSE-PSE-MK54-09C]|nr:apolipoprotein N-acyltransferase [Kaiparowitsia implicata GSE-PSE-MK54-09C]
MKRLQLNLFNPWLGRGAIALFSGVLMGLAPAPFHLWLLPWGAIAPLWILVTASATSRPLLRYPLLWGIGYYGLALSWIVDLHPLTWMGIPWLGSVAIALFAWGFITLWGAAIPTVWCVLLHYALRPLASRGLGLGRLAALRIVLGTGLWCALEQLWSYGPLDWTFVAYTQSPINLPLLHLGQLSGPLTGSAVLVAVNGCLAEAWHAWSTPASQRSTPPLRRPHPSRSFLLTAAGLVLVAHLVGWGLASQPLRDTPADALTVGLVQGNVPTRIKLFEEGYQMAIAHYTQGYEALAAQGVDVVLMPEGAFPWQWVGTARQAQNPLHQAIVAAGVPAWVGTVGRQNGRYTQTLFTLLGDGSVYSQYNKVKLVPLGEYVPLEQTLGQVIGRLSLDRTSMVPGNPNQVLDTPFGRAIAAICYESAFPWLFRQQAAQGGEFIITASNNDPYRMGMMAQHHAHDLMRAIETNRYALRATNTGLSGVVDPHGRTLWLSEYQTLQIHVATIYRRRAQTPYSRWGNWFTPLLIVLGITLWLWQWRQTRLV